MTTPNQCPYCSMDVPQGSTTCPNCGGAVGSPEGGAQGGYSPVSPPSGGGGFGSPPSGGGGFGSPPSGGGGFGSPPSGSGGFGSPPSGSGGFGTPASGGFGSPPSGGGFGTPPSGGGGYGAPPHLTPAPTSKSGGCGKVGVLIAAIIVLAILIGIGSCIYFVANAPPARPVQRPPIGLNQPVQGEITASQDHQVYELGITEPTQVTITVQSNFDSYLELYRWDNDSSPFLQDDDSAGNLDARISTNLDVGVYFVLVRPFSDGTGTFTVTVATAGGGGGQIPPTGGGQIPPTGAGMITPSVFQGTIASVTGAAPVQTGGQCSVQLVPTDPGATGFNCRFQINCGGQLIYGAGNSGFNNCSSSDMGGRQIIQANDSGLSSQDSDPRMSFQGMTNQVIISDDSGGSIWTVIIQLTSPGVPGSSTST